MSASASPIVVGKLPDRPDVDLRLFECESFESIFSDFELEAAHFVALLIADFKVLTRDQIQAAGVELIRRGCRYFCAWDPDCTDAHLAFDLACVEFHKGDCDKGAILTGDFHRDPLEEAIWFTLFCSCPVEPYDLDWHATIAICINDPGSARVVEAAFRNAREFLDNWPQKD